MHKKKFSQRILDLVLAVILIIGLIILIQPIYQSRIIDSKKVEYEISEFEKNLTIEKEKDTSAVSIKEKENDLIGVVYIPKIKISLPVYKGLSEYALSLGVGTVPGFDNLSGEDGTHAVLSSHNGLSTQGLFSNLSELAVGDEYYVKNKSGMTIKYVVDTIDVVRPDQTEIYDRDASHHISTLITCESVDGINSHRRLVTGKKVEEIKEFPLVEVHSSNALAPMSTYEKVVATMVLLVILILVIPKKKKKKAKQETTHEENNQ